MSFRRTGALLAFVALQACASAKPLPKTPIAVTIATLYPLVQGAAWSYDVDSGDGAPVLATARVTAVRDNLVEVESGQARLHYMLEPNGIARVGQSGYLLKAPLVASASWPSAPDTIARVESLHRHVVTPAGAFEECVVVREDNASSGQHVTTTYCPGVGPVTVVSEMEVRGHALRVVATLRGYAFSEPG